MTPKADTIIKLEQRFWQSMVDKDADVAMAMIADESLVSGPQGTMKISPQKYGEMTREGKWRLDTFKLSEVDVVFPADNVAVIAYMDMTCVDSSTWVKDGGTWKCALHTETIVEDAAKSTKH